MRQTAEATRWGARGARRGWWILAGVAAALLAAGVLGGTRGGPAAAQAPRVPRDCAAWTAVTSPDPGTGDNALAAISAAGAADIWAVGAYTDTSGMARPLAVHWDGSTWTANSPPSPGSGGATLDAVHALAADDVWAVGRYQPAAGGVYQTLTEHWTGSGWTMVASPNHGSLDNRLLGVTALAANDAWAVGYYATSPLPLHTLTEHWNGSAWAEVSAPNPGLGGGLAGITGFGASDVWAVGAYGIDLLGDASPLVVHWTGSAWAQVSAPTTGSSALLANVGGVSSGDLWAVGASLQSGTYQTLTEHWTGASWAIVPSPSFGAGSNALGGIAPIGSSDVWAVGGYDSGTRYQTLALHWDGTAWTAAPSEDPGSVDNRLMSATVAGGTAWAAGTWQSTGPVQTLIEAEATGPCATATPTAPAPSATPTVAPPTGTPEPSATPPAATATATAPAASPTPGAATATPPPAPSATGVPPTATASVAAPTATGTPAATETPCPLSFSDVHASDYFYQPVLYLACHGVISGYAGGTFRPYNNTTRAQMVKIVVLGFGLPSTTPAAGGYTFADVPPTFPFFDVVETAAAGQIVSGYACGGPGEPCDGANRPYFRPYADVTRGQLAKIVVLTAGWAVQNPADPPFADVAPGSAFYSVVATAACHGIISGYACGGPGEPCDPQQRPYFRQYNNATRGQIAKIVYLSLTSPGGCAP